MCHARSFCLTHNNRITRPQEQDATRVGFIQVGDTVETLYHSNSNFNRCQLKRFDGLVGWAHAYAPGGQRVLSAHDPGTKCDFRCFSLFFHHFAAVFIVLYCMFSLISLFLTQASRSDPDRRADVADPLQKGAPADDRKGSWGDDRYVRKL